MRLRIYMWLFGARWVPDFIRVWACRKGGTLLLKTLDDEPWGR